LASATDKGQALFVFIGAGAFAHEDHLSVGITLPEDDGLATAGELAPLAVAEVFANLVERLTFATWWRRRFEEA
jgi:hypothetical protein